MQYLLHKKTDHYFSCACDECVREVGARILDDWVLPWHAQWILKRRAGHDPYLLFYHISMEEHGAVEFRLKDATFYPYASVLGFEELDVETAAFWFRHGNQIHRFTRERADMIIIPCAVAYCTILVSIPFWAVYLWTPSPSLLLKLWLIVIWVALAAFPFIFYGCSLPGYMARDFFRFWRRHPSGWRHWLMLRFMSAIEQVR